MIFGSVLSYDGDGEHYGRIVANHQFLTALIGADYFLETNVHYRHDVFC